MCRRRKKFSWNRAILRWTSKSKFTVRDFFIDFSINFLLLCIFKSWTVKCIFSECTSLATLKSCWLDRLHLISGSSLFCYRFIRCRRTWSTDANISVGLVCGQFEAVRCHRSLVEPLGKFVSPFQLTPHWERYFTDSWISSEFLCTPIFRKHPF